MSALKDHPVVAKVLAVQKRYSQVQGGYLAVTITYYGFLSIFPLMLLALAAIGFFLAGDPATHQQWVDLVSDAVPGLGPLIGDSLEAIVAARAGAGIIGLLGLLWTGTALTQSAGYAMSQVYGTEQLQGFVKVKSWAIGTTLALGALALAGLALATMVGGARETGVVGTILRAAGIPVTLAVDFVLFAAAYRLIVQRPGPPFRELWKGALFAATGWAALKLLGSWYAARTVAGATAVYGAFGSVVGILALLYLGARLFVYGGVINTTRLGERQDRRRGGEPMPEEMHPNGKHHDKPTAELVQSIAGDMATLVQKEVELARHEIVEAVTARVKATMAMGTAAVMGLFVLGFLALSAAAALDTVMAPWASRLIVAAVLGVLAAGAAGFGLMRMKRPPLMPEETKRTVKEDVEWAKAQLKR